MYDVVLIVAPVFGLITLGYLLGRFNVLSEDAGKGLAEFVFTVAVPALLFRMMVTAEMGEGASPFALWGSYYFSAAVIWVLAALATKFILHRPARDGASIAMGSTFGNIVMLGIPLALDRFGAEAATPIAIIISISSPLMWSAATLHVEMASEREQLTWGEQFKGLVLALAKNPLIMGLVAGLVWRWTGLGLHPIPGKMISLLAQVAIPGSLVALGLGLTAFKVRGQVSTVTVMCVLSLMAFPALVWLLAFHVFALPPVWAGVAVLFSACPPGANAYLFASRYDAATGSVSAAVALGTVLSDHLGHHHPGSFVGSNDVKPHPMIDFVIIGGGILGLATAFRLLQERPGASLVLIDKEQRLAYHQTGHNSGVIHAGVYYKPGSAKAKLCKQGAERTVRFCEQHGIEYERCGKLIVATDAQETARLKGLEDRVIANGLDYENISAGRLREIEPNIAGEAALLVHATGIVNYTDICNAMADVIRGAGGDIRLGTALTGIAESDSEIVAETDKGAFTARTLIVCAGLQGDRIAMMAGIDIDFRVLPFRGEYYRVAKARGDLVKHLIYPVPDPSLPFLGVHLTRIIDGSLTVGPNAMLSLGRETYSGNYPVPRDMADMMSFPGFYKLMASFAAAGLYEMRGSLSKRVYLERCRKYCPSLKLEDLEPMEAGIRAQSVSSDGKLIDDFLFLETSRSLHMCNAPSPAATCALPIADEIVARALRKAN